jgi:tetratricopeptide (TPR) repeat protein
MADLNHPDEFQRALNEGAWLLRQNKHEEALERLLPLYDIAPANPEVAINVGGAYILGHKWNKAVRVLSRAAELHPDNVMIWTNLGAAHLGRLELAGPQQQERSIRAYERALAIDPKAPNVHYILGLIYKDRQEFNRATAFFQRALEVNPADRDAQYWIDWLEAQAAPPRALSDEVQGASAPDGGADGHGVGA